MSEDEKSPIPIEQLAKSSPYPASALNFVREGLSYTVRKLNKDSEENKHITGRELCFGLRDYAVEKWGLLARTVLNQWNIYSTMDFGKIVYLLIEGGWMTKNNNDSIDDFKEVFDFEVEFRVKCNHSYPEEKLKD